MLKKLSVIVPLVIFLILILGVGYFIWIQPPPPTPIVATTDPPALTPTPFTPTPTEAPADPASPTPVLFTPTTVTGVSPTLTPTVPQKPTPTDTPPSPKPTSTVALSLTPTASITGIVIPDNLNVRWGPGLEYGYVGAVYKGDEVVILKRTPATDWLEIITPDKKQGWVGASFIGNIEGNLKPLPTVVAPPPPPLPTAPPIEITSFDLDGPSAFGSLEASKERWYAFSEKNKETVFILMFKPGLNGLQVSILDQDQTNQWRTVGVGSLPAADRDGDLNTRELIWRGGPLILGKTYYLQLINDSQETIEYCLMPKDVDQWDCP
jgi:hypothetical protein